MLNIGCCASLIGAPVRGARALGREQGIELAGVLERRKLVESADVPLADVDLRHGAAALPERLPVSHTTITGFALCFSSSAERASSSPSGMLRAASTCPFSYSAASRTSSIRVFCWFMSSVAWRVETDALPPARRTAGQTSIAPLTSATPTRNRLSPTNLIRLTSAMSRFPARRGPALARRGDEKAVSD